MCNRLFIWAHGFVYSSKYNLPYAVNGWYKTQIGPWIRRERSKRFYSGYFIDQSDFVGYYYRKVFRKKGIIYNPALDKPPFEHKIHTIIFDTIPYSGQYFNELKGYNRMIKKGLLDMIVRPIRERIQHAIAPEIGVHVRLGDFQVSNSTESMNFYIDAINYIRQQHGENLTAVIFSDGYEEELKDLLALPAISLHQSRTDIEDLMLLSKSNFIVTSHTSTFSYWAVYLSDAIAIYNKNYTGQPIRWDELIIKDNLLVESPMTITTNVPE